MSGNLPNMIWVGQLQGTPRLERDWWWFDDVREWNLGTSWLFQPCKITWQSGIDDLHYELDVHCNHASRILIANIAHGLMSPSHANPVYHIRRRGSFFHAISSGPCQNFTLCNLEQSSESLDQVSTPKSNSSYLQYMSDKIQEGHQQILALNDGRCIMFNTFTSGLPTRSQQPFDSKELWNSRSFASSSFPIPLYKDHNWDSDQGLPPV